MKAERLPAAGGSKSPLAAQDSNHLFLERLVTVYERTLENTPHPRACLEQHGITRELWSRHRLGYSDGGLSELLPQKGPIIDQLIALGLLTDARNDRLVGCLVCPVIDAEGAVVSLVAQPLSHPTPGETTLPGIPGRIWNIGAVKSHAHLIAVRSVLHGLILQAAGFENVVGLPAQVGDTDRFFLKSHGAVEVTLLVKQDDASNDENRALLAALSEWGSELRALPPGQDLPGYLKAHGASGLTELFRGQASAEVVTTPSATGQVAASNSFTLRLGIRSYLVRGLEKGPRKVRATVRVEQAGKLHIDTLDFYLAKARRSLVQDLARIFEASTDLIDAEVTKVMEACERHEPVPDSASAALLPGMSAEARAAAEALGREPQLLERISTDFEACGLVGEKTNALLAYLALSSRKMSKPLSILIVSSSGAGKTTLQDLALLFCPPEDLVKVTSLSTKALFYKEAGSLKHKVLAVEEGEGMSKTSYALRNLISAGALVIQTTSKDPATGKLLTVEHRVEGPTSVFITTTDPATDPETKSRFFVTGIDESRHQTRAILAAQRRHQTWAGESAQGQLDSILRVHRDFQRLLRPVAVINPYADQLLYDDDWLQGRRDQPKYLNLIKAVAFLRQMQKPSKVLKEADAAREYVEVDLEDIGIANDLMAELVGHSLGELSRPGYELLQLLEQMTVANAEARTFTRREIREFAGWNNARVHRYLRELLQLEYVLAERAPQGQPHRYRSVYQGQGKSGEKFVLGLRRVEELRAQPGV